MKVYDNTYSRLIAWLKVLLPLMALAILSTLFLVSRRPDTDATLPYNREDVEQILREQSIVAPTYTGVTSDGAALSLSARTAQPKGESGTNTSAEQLNMLIEMPDGATLHLTAATAALDMSGRRARLRDGVHIETSTGYTMKADAVTTALDITEVETEADVSGTAPFGTLSAGKMRLNRETGLEGAPYLLLFTEGVDLLYEPKSDQGGRK